MIIVRVWAMSMGRFPLVQDVGVTLVWRPAWGPRTMATEDSRAALGVW